MLVTITTLVVLYAGMLAAPATQTPQTSERVILAGTARVERIDISTRTVTLRGDNNQMFAVYVEPQFKIFDQLKTGDRVKVRVVDSVVVAVLRNARPAIVADTTAAARKQAADDSSQVLQQLKMVVTIESIDAKAQTVVYKTADNRSVTRYAVDPRLLEGLKKGDVVELTYTRERAVELEKQ